MSWSRSKVEGLRQPQPGLGLAVLAAVAVAALASPLTYDLAVAVDLAARSTGPSSAHWLGTDHLGRDLFWRLVTAAGAFAGPGVGAAALCVAVAVPAGAAAGWYGGWIAGALRFGFTTLSAVPRFVLVLLVFSIYGNNLWLLSLAAGASYVPTLGESLYSRISELSRAEYVVANRAYGVPDWRILWVHLVWAAAGSLILRHALLLFGYVLVLECTLSYFDGFGVQEPAPSWGNMLVFEMGRTSGLGVLLPGAAIWLTVLAISWVSAALDDEVQHA